MTPEQRIANELALKYNFRIVDWPCSGIPETEIVELSSGKFEISYTKVDEFMFIHEMKHLA